MSDTHAGNTSRRTGRQAVVIVHGMGEQRPLDALTGFINAGLPPDDGNHRLYYSRPDIVGGGYDSRRFLAPATADRPQTEFFEYHWAHLMQGNRLRDMRSITRRLLLRPPWRVPAGLRLAWLLIWLLGIALACIIAIGPIHDELLQTWEDAYAWLLGLAGGALLILVLAFLLGHIGMFIPGILTNSFADVVRYLDTTPRSYEVRRQIRKGFVDLLENLHTSRYGGNPRYQRIVIVAHSLGAYIAYDGISYLWSTMNTRARQGASGAPDGLRGLEAAARWLDEDSEEARQTYRRAQYRLWTGLRAQGNPWLITDFVSVGTPMYFADVLAERTPKRFATRVRRRELPTCPPQNEERAGDTAPPHYSYSWRGREVLYGAAPFAVVRWSNLWFPSAPRWFGATGDWFGGPLRPLFGDGVHDVRVTGNRPKRWIPAFAHGWYFKFPDDHHPDSITAHLKTALDLGDTHAHDPWLRPTRDQIDTARHLLHEAGFSCRRMTRKHVDLTDPREPVPRQSVRDWLSSMTRSQLACLIEDLNWRVKRKKVGTLLDPEE
ncbi:hypothetical protein [Yinghuangia seranimata]|uniref:hypothetical protein n=1 Tax=Yinghuangia seranimata TaxID=408067 RepID=UPI00248B0531|nr:hypothetical protein [Yinghuangia seranimata]MDI2125536.1 hypothetical protein [Yinghuangia seranimata]